jgi:hypothetical protein
VQEQSVKLSNPTRALNDKMDSRQSVRGAANHQNNPALGTGTGGQNQQQSNQACSERWFTRRFSKKKTSI